MTILLTNAGKRFNREWIFRHFDFQFITGINYAITGPNGSGKSTLLQLIAGAISPSEGNISYQSSTGIQGKSPSANVENIYQYISIAAPYLELIEEMTLQEFLQFHQQFKPFLPTITSETIIKTAGLEKAAHKQIRFFSSGMKQRVKLAQSVFSDTPVLLLDEPCTNLDAEGISLYHQLIENYTQNRLVIVSSNDEVEYRFCEKKINIYDYK